MFKVTIKTLDQWSEDTEQHWRRPAFLIGNFEDVLRNMFIDFIYVIAYWAFFKKSGKAPIDNFREIVQHKLQILQLSLLDF